MAACPLGDLVCPAQGVVDLVSGAVSTVTAVADFWSDPFGNTFNALEGAAKSLSDSILPAFTHATLPDLTLDWFINAYRVSFGLAIFVMVALIIPQIVRTARGQQSGRDLAETLGLYAPLFLIGSAFGPLLGSFLVSFFSALSDALTSWGIQTSSQTIVDKFSAMLASQDGAAGIAGGAVVGCLLMLLMIAGLLIVVLILIVQLITLYFSGILFPLGFVWIIDKSKRRFGSKIAYLWFGILASHPLLFFMLAIAYSMVSSSVDVFTETPSLDRTVTLVVSVLSLLIAGFSPMLLMKFAPVLPMGGGGGAPAGPTIGSNSMQEADSKYGGASSSSGQEGSGSSGAGGDPGGSSAGASTAAGKSASAGVKASSAGASEGAGAAAGAAGGMAAEGGMVAAGAAESSTGVGAVVGVPTMLAGLAAAGGAAAKKATDSAKKVTDSVGAAAVEPIADHEAQYGKGSIHE